MVFTPGKNIYMNAPVPKLKISGVVSGTVSAVREEKTLTYNLAATTGQLMALIGYFITSIS